MRGHNRRRGQKRTQYPQGQRQKSKTDRLTDAHAQKKNVCPCASKLETKKGQEGTEEKTVKSAKR